MISQLWVNCNTWKMLKILINILGKLWCKIWMLQTLKRHIFVASPKHFWEPKAINFMETFQPLEESSSRRYPRGRFPGDHKENLWVPKGRKRNNYEVWANWVHPEEGMMCDGVAQNIPSFYKLLEYFLHFTLKHYHLCEWVPRHALVTTQLLGRHGCVPEVRKIITILHSF